MEIQIQTSSMPTYKEIGSHKKKSYIKKRRKKKTRGMLEKLAEFSDDLKEDDFTEQLGINTLSIQKI